MSNTNGHFSITDLVNRVEPFEFTFDGLTLSGEWYKYRTTTPDYGRDAYDAVPEIPQNASDEERARISKLRMEALEKLSAQALKDTIKSWNAVDENGPVPIEIEVFERFPLPFIEALSNFFRGLRNEAANPPKSAPSSSG